jgi:hypothetical protein
MGIVSVKFSEFIKENDESLSIDKRLLSFNGLLEVSPELKNEIKNLAIAQRWSKDKFAALKNLKVDMEQFKKKISAKQLFLDLVSAWYVEDKVLILLYSEQHGTKPFTFYSDDPAAVPCVIRMGDVVYVKQDDDAGFKKINIDSTEFAIAKKRLLMHFHIDTGTDDMNFAYSWVIYKNEI